MAHVKETAEVRLRNQYLNPLGKHQLAFDTKIPFYFIRWSKSIRDMAHITEKKMSYISMHISSFINFSLFTIVSRAVIRNFFLIHLGFQLPSNQHRTAFPFKFV